MQDTSFPVINFFDHTYSVKYVSGRAANKVIV